jgi:hypothetical protein
LAYGVLGLKPHELYSLTPGEYADLLEARQWVRKTQQRHTRGPMTPEQRKAELAKLDQRINKE